MNSSVIIIKKDDWTQPIIGGIKAIKQVHIPQERHGIRHIHSVSLMAHNGLYKHQWTNACWHIEKKDNSVIVMLEGELLLEGEVHIVGETAPLPGKVTGLPPGNVGDHFDTAYRAVLEIFPDAECIEDEDGQLIICTGVKQLRGGRLEPMED